MQHQYFAQMKSENLLFKQVPTLIVLAILTINSVAQNRSLSLTKKQALEDLHWLRFSLEYVHPRLYKYDEKKAVDARMLIFRLRPLIAKTERM
jgi:hypothetical protein